MATVIGRHDEVATTPPSALWRESERRRLVRLCAVLTGDGQAAEDLAQETLLEAWRNAHKLRDPAGADRWLSAIARNVCLRWARRRGRDLAALAPLEDEPAAAAEADLEDDLERADLVDLLDRALARLPSEARDVLVGHYVEGASHGDVAARLGLSEAAVSMRVSRGKAALRRLLASELSDEAAAHGLLEEGGGDWRATRVWCSECGRRRLLARVEPPPGVVAFRCPGCHPEPSALDSELKLSNPFFARLVGGLVRPTAIRARTAAWSAAYFAPDNQQVACTRCGGAVALRPYVRSRAGVERHGRYAACAACGEAVSTSAVSLASAQPSVQRFLRRHARTRTLPQRELEADGVPAIVVGHEDVSGTARIEVVLARDTLRALAVYGPAA